MHKSASCTRCLAPFAAYFWQYGKCTSALLLYLRFALLSTESKSRITPTPGGRLIFFLEFFSHFFLDKPKIRKNKPPPSGVRQAVMHHDGNEALQRGAHAALGGTTLWQF